MEYICASTLRKPQAVVELLWPLLPPHTLGGGAPQVLEVVGLAEGLQPGEVEQQLEPLMAFGAHLQVLTPGGGQPPQPRVLAVFDSPQAAQGALLGVKGPAFQLRPLHSPQPPS